MDANSGKRQRPQTARLRNRLPRGLALQFSQKVGNALLALAALSSFPFTKKEKEGKGYGCWPGSQKQGC